MSKKLEEKQRRRQIQEERDAAKKKAARRRNLLTWGVVVVVVAIVGTLIYLESSKEEGTQATSEGCSSVETPGEMETATHVEDGTPVEYSTSPPTSGDHYSTPADAGFYSAEDIPVERFVHNLEHGQIVFWYRPDASESVISALRSYVESDPQEIALLARPFDGISSEFSFTVTAWGASQSCAELNEDTLAGFRERFQGNGPEQVGVPGFR